MYFHAHPEMNAQAQAAAISRRPAAPERSRRFLVAFDGSPAARGALEYAVERVKAEGSELHVVNVQDALIDSAVFYRSYQEQGEWILEDVAEQLAPHDVRFTAEIAFGSPAHAIVRTARKARCDHIVMGTRSRSGIATLLSPRVSRQVLRLADVPVTVIKEVTK
jgi:nucleotide-binding universal stress UspA family protein